MYKKYDEESGTHYRVSYHDSKRKKQSLSAYATEDFPDLEKVNEVAKKNGYDTFEVFEVNEVIKRYQVD